MVPCGVVVTGKCRRTSSGYASGDNALVCDSQGKWVRRTGVARDAAARDFVFDDRAIENALPFPTSAPPPVFRLNDAEGAPDSGFDVAAGNRPTDTARTNDDFDPVPPALESHPEAAPIFGRIFSPALRLLGGALLFGAVLLLFQRTCFGAMRDVGAPLPPPAIVAPVPAPLVPKQTVRNPAARAVVPPASRPAVTDLAEAGATLPLPPLSQPDPPHFAAGESVPDVAAFSQAPSDEEGWFKLAGEYLQMGDEERAEDLYRHLFNEGTQQGRATLALGDLFAGRNDFNRAEEYYRAATLLYRNSDQPTSPP